MILKLTNKSKNFYAHLGKFFGSREVERITHDRIYDDDDKEWYIKFIRDKPVAFVSIKNNKIKNIYGYKDEDVLEILEKINKELIITDSIVTKYYKDLYIKAGFEIFNGTTTNFIKIRSVRNEKN